MIDGFALALQYGALVRDVVPAWLVPVFLGITRLGNVAVFLVVFAIDYWFVDHERGAHAIAVVVGGMALITALKFLFAVPRPPETVNVVPISGYSFPSGHATGATIAYGVFAYDVDVGPRHLRYAAAALLVALVALSRVVLGVHFVRDVVAGVLFGVGFLVVAFTLTGHAPRPGFRFAAGLGVVAFVVSGASHDGTAVLGAALGALVTWEALESIPTVERTASRVVLVGGVLPALAVVGYVSLRWGLSMALVFLLNAGIFVAILVAPVVEYRFEDSARPTAG